MMHANRPEQEMRQVRELQSESLTEHETAANPVAEQLSTARTALLSEQRLLSCLHERDDEERKQRPEAERVQEVPAEVAAKAFSAVFMLNREALTASHHRWCRL